MKKIFVFLCLLMLIGLYACSNSDSGMEGSDDAEYESAEQNSDDAGFREESSAEDSSSEMDEEGSAGGEPMKSKRMMIRTGYIDIEVSDYSTTVDRINQELNSVNGYIVRSSEYDRGKDENASGEMTVRVPEEHFDDFMNSLESEDARILSKRTEGEDVTEEYVDLESRLRAQQAVEERLLSFMADAEKTEDLLKISNDLSNVQQEIETIKGRMNYIENHVSFSTVTISIQERAVNVPEVQSQSELNTMSNAQKLFMDTVNFLLKIGSGIVVMVVGLSPIVVPILIIGLIIFFKLRKKSKTD